MKKPSLKTISEILSYYMQHYVEAHCIDYERQKYACKPLNLAVGYLSPRQLNSAIIQKYMTSRMMGELGRNVGTSTVRRELVVLISALNYCANQLLIKRDFPKISLPAENPPKDLFLDEDELDAFVDLAAKTQHVDDRLSRIYRFVAIVSETASRKTAVQKLKWTQVNFSSKIIEFQKDGQRQKNKRRVPVPISDRLLPILERAYKERLEGCEYVLDTPFSIQHHFEALVKSACEQIGEKYANVTPHTLRHSWATLAAKNGVDLRQIAGVLGDSEATVDRVYAHHHPAYLKGAINYRSRK
jgi:integrase